MYGKILSAAFIGCVLSAQALALPIGTSFFSASEALVNTSGSGGFLFSRDTDVSVDGTASAATTSLNVSGVVEGQAMAESVLSTGTLRAYGELTDFYYENAPTSYASTWAHAAFGDSFTHLDGNNPFLFGDGATSTFRFTIDGTIDRSDPDFSAVAYLAIFILEHGSLGDVVEDNGQFFCCPLSPVFSDNLIEYVEVGLTPESIFGDDYYNPANSSTIEIDTVVGDTFEYSFNPGRDFDWVVQLRVGSAVLPIHDPAPSGNRAITDFYNTINVDYVAPTGAIARSASGVFPMEAVTVTVPEPGTAGMVIAGLLLLAARRKALGAGTR